jgi:hypothetical protein
VNRRLRDGIAKPRSTVHLVTRLIVIIQGDAIYLLFVVDTKRERTTSFASDYVAIVSEGSAMRARCATCMRRSGELRQRAAEDSYVSQLLGLAFPHDDDAITLLAERGLYACVARDVCIKFRQPETTIAGRGRSSAAARMAMPEAAVHEDGPLATSVCDVRRAREVAIVNPEAMAERMENSPHGQFGGCSMLSDSTEPSRCLCVDD